MYDIVNTVIVQVIKYVLWLKKGAKSQIFSEIKKRGKE